MKILFVYSLDDIYTAEKPLRNQDQIQFGISYISSYLKLHGHQTNLVILGKILKKNNFRTINAVIEKFKPQVVCFTAVATEFNFIGQIAAYVKKNHAYITTVIGGPHATLKPEIAINTPGFDIACVGEGEQPMLELASQLEAKQAPAKIKNLWIKKDGSIEKNPARPFKLNLDTLPFPDRDMWQPWIDEQPGSRQAILLGRGCPFNCTYCSNHALKKVAPGQYYRLRSVNNITREIALVAMRFPRNREIYLEIETIGIDMPWTLNLCRELGQLNQKLAQPLSYGINLRIIPGQDYDKLFAAFQKANFRFLNIGLESGSQRVRQESLARNYDNQDIIKAVKSARQYDLKIAFYNMIGLPGETRKDFQDTINMNRLCQPDWHWTAIFYPYPGTELYQRCLKENLITKPLADRQERSRPVLNLPGFNKRQIKKCYTWFDYYVYKDKKPLTKIFYQVMLKKINTTYFLKFYLTQLLIRFPILRKSKELLQKRLKHEVYILKEKKSA